MRVEKKDILKDYFSQNNCTMKLFNKKQTKIIIIGAGQEQIRAYTIARDMGLFIIGTDMNPEAPALQYADAALICSTRDVPATLTEVSKYSKSGKIHGVMTIGNDAALTVAAVAELLGTPSISTKSAECATNKMLMKSHFIEHSIPTPGYVVIDSRDKLFRELANKEFPLVIKPTDGRGSRGVLFLDQFIDLNWAWEYALDQSDNKILLLEDFIHGDQLSVEGIFVNGKYIAVAFADRNYTNLDHTKPFIIEDGGIIPSYHEGQILVDISNCIEAAAKSLGIDQGPVKADIVLADEGPMIIEIAARLSGNYLASHHLRWSLGVDIVHAVLKYSIGQEIDEKNLEPQFKKYLAARYFFPSKGWIKKINGISMVNSLEYVKKLEIYRKEGEFQPTIESNVDRAGIVRCMGNSLEEATKRVEDAVKMISFSMDLKETK